MGARRGWLWGMMLAAVVAGEAADSGKRVVTAVSRADKPVAAVSSGGGRINFTQLTSGSPAPFSLPAVGQPTLFVGDAGYRITVPSGATRLTVSLITTTPNVDVDLYVRAGQDPAVAGGSVVADYRSEGLTGNETITITGASSPVLQAGTYHISLLLFDTNVAASGTLTATVETGGGPPPPSGGTQLTSGVSAPFSFAAVTEPTLFFGGNSYRIDVPSGATQLVVQVNTATPGVDVDLYMRFGLDTAVSGGGVVADHSSEGLTGNETITITGASSPPLRAGTYFISLALFTTGTPASGTVMATVTGGGGGGGGIPDLTGTWSWSANCTGSLFSGQYRISTQQASGAFSGDFLNTNSGDSGTINDGFINGNQVGFRRTLPGGAVQLWTATLVNTLTGLRLDGTVSQGGSQICTFVATRGGGGGGGGGGGVLTNPSFELPGGTTSFINVGQGQTTIPAWSVTRGSVDIVSTQLFNCSDGNFCIDMDGTSFGGLSQVFATTPGAAYTVMFDMAGNPGGGPTVKQMRAMAAGQSQDFSFDTTGRSGTNMGWTTRTFAFTASGSSTTLEFQSTHTSGGAYGAMIDNVRVAAGGGGGGGGGTGTLGTNLIQNPGAEAGPADPSCNGVPSIPGWTTAGVTGVCRYGTGGGWPLMTDPGPPDRGNNLFNGGNAATSSISQTIDVSGLASQIDGGGVTFALSGYLGGFAGDDDNARLRAVFQNASGTTLRTDTIGPVLAAERGNQTKLLLKSATGPVPAGTRRVGVTLEFTRVSGSADDGYADSLSLILNSSGGGGGGGGSTPVLSVSPSLDFGSVTVGQQRDLTLTIRNTGTATLNVTGLTSSNSSEFSVVGAASFTVAPAGQQDVTLRFRPSATGSRSSNLTVSNNDPSRPSTNISLTGTGTSAGSGAQIGASTTSLNFSTSTGTNPSPQTFTIRNSGTGTLSFRVTSNQTWLSSNPSTGTSTGQSVNVSANVNVGGLAAGNYTGELRVTDSTGIAASAPGGVDQATPVVITVRLTIQAGGGGSCPAGPSSTPAITAGAIVNAASFVSSALPNGAIARGAIFTMFLRNGGPTALQLAASFPLQTTLGCVSVRVTAANGSTSVDAIPLAAIASQVNAIMPSNAPLGDATITVTFNGRTSGAQRVRIVESAFGFFTANQNGMGPAIVQNFESQTSVPINSPRRPLLRGRRGIAYGTGLGGIRTADNQPAPGGDPQVNVELTLGNKRAVVEYAGRTPGFAGLDQINFVVADDTPLGCYVPLTARIGGVITNTVTVAVSDNPAECSDPFNPYASFVSRGGKLGSIQMIRVNARLLLDASANFTNIDADVGTAAFSEFPAGGEFAYNPLSALPPLGSCTSASAGGIDLSGLLGGAVPGAPGVTGRILDAGPALQINGAGGTKVLPRSTDIGGIYFNLIGGTVPIPGLPLPSSPLYLNPGDFTVTGPGGPDIGPFSAQFRVPPSFTWSNREAVTQSNRANGVSVSWSGGEPSSQAITILGGNLDQDTGAGALFVCFVPFGPGNFTIPAAVTQSLPPSNLSDPTKTVGFLLVGAGPGGNFPTFTAPNMDQGFVFFVQFSATSVIWR